MEVRLLSGAVLLFMARRLRKDRVPDASSTCSFCGMSIWQSAFVAIGRFPPLSTICSTCIRNLGILNQVVSHHQNIANGDTWDSVRAMLVRSISEDQSASQLGTLAVGLTMRFLMRAIALMGGCETESCPKTGVLLAPPRIAVVGADAGAIADLLMLLSPVSGIPIERMSVAGSIDDHLHWLRQKSNNDPLLFPLAVLLIEDGFIEINSECAVVSCCRHGHKFPPDVRLIDLDE